MGGGGHQVLQEADTLPRALDQDRLVKRNMPRRGQAADAGERRSLAGHQGERHRLEIGREVARRRALVGVPGELELSPLHDVGGPRKRDANGPSTTSITSITSTTSTILHNLPKGVATGVIEV